MTTAGSPTFLQTQIPVDYGLASACQQISPKTTFQFLTPRHWAQWDEFVREHPGGTIFHSLAWMHSVRDVFRHQPRYMIATQSDQIVGVLPVFEIKSWLGGTMMVSVPYAVGGGALATDDAVRDGLVRHAISLATTRHARSFDLRSESPSGLGLTPVKGYAVFRRELPSRSEDVLDWLPRKARAAARNAENKFGLTAQFDTKHLRTVWKLYSRSMRRLGSIAYPFRFFEELVARFGKSAFVQLVRKDRKIVAGLISFRFGNTFLPYFAGCDERYLSCWPNNFLYLSAMRKAVDQGCAVFDFGRTRTANRGAFDFKRFHGFEPQPLSYERWEAPGQISADLTPGNPRLQFVRRVWKKLPLSVTRIAGSVAARHIPG